MTTLQSMKNIMNKIRLYSNYGAPFLRNLVLIEDEHSNNCFNVNPKSEILFRMPVSDEFCNSLNIMHGGAISTLIDVTSTIAISGFDKYKRQNVSVELSTTFLNPIKINSNILIHVKVPKIGKAIAYSTADIFSEDSLMLCAKGSHVKAMTDKKFD
jgi:uncharacterized protein (TIGR00369 family)